MLQSGRSTARRSAVLVSALVLIGGAAAWGADGPKTTSPAKKGAASAAAGRDQNNGGVANPLVAYDRRVQALYAAAQVLRMTHALGALGLLKADASLSLWQDFIHKLPPAESPEPSNDAESEPTIPPNQLTGVKDGAPLRTAEENDDEAWAYGYVLLKARSVPAEDLQKHARKGVTYVHMLENPRSYRGQIIHIEGKLRRLRRFESPSWIWKAGVRDLYEAWVSPKGNEFNALCVIITQLPSGLVESEAYSPPIDVSFDGYFFKKYRYQSVDPEKKKPVLLDTPLLIGSTLRVAKVEESSVDPKAELADLMPLIVGIVVGTILLVGGLTWWFRRGDRAVESRINAARASAFVEPSSDDQESLPDAQWSTEAEHDVPRAPE